MGLRPRRRQEVDTSIFSKTQRCLQFASLIVHRRDFDYFIVKSVLNKPHEDILHFGDILEYKFI